MRRLVDSINTNISEASPYNHKRLFIESFYTGLIENILIMKHTKEQCKRGRIQRGGGGGQGFWTPLKITSAKVFLRYTGTDPLEKQLDPFVPCCFSSEVRTYGPM